MAYINVIGAIQPLREKYSPLVIGDIGTVSEEEWAKHWRPHGSGWRDPRPNNPCYLDHAYGGSDMGTITDTSNFECKLGLWAIKTGKPMKVVRQNGSDITERGHIYEYPTVQKYCVLMKRAGKKNFRVLSEGKVLGMDGKPILDPKTHRPIENRASMWMYRDNRKNPDGGFKYPWALANCDAFVTDDGVMGGLEIKTTNYGRNRDTVENEWKNGIIPIYYLYQIVYYMAILNLQFWDICCSWSQEFDDTAIIRFYRDYDLEDELFRKVSEFDDYVVNDIEPDPSTCQPDLLVDYYSRYFGPVQENSNDIVELPEKYVPTMLKAIELDKQLKKLEEEKKKIEAEMAKVHAEIYPIIGANAYAQCRLDDDTVCDITLKTPTKYATEYNGVDLDRLQADHPEIVEKYKTFDASAFGANEKLLKKQYTLPKVPDIESTTKKSGYKLKLRNVPVVKSA